MYFPQELRRMPALRFRLTHSIPGPILPHDQQLIFPTLHLLLDHSYHLLHLPSCRLPCLPHILVPHKHRPAPLLPPHPQILNERKNELQGLIHPLHHPLSDPRSPQIPILRQLLQF